MPEDGLSKLSTGTLKSVLFQNHVNARLLLEKPELVARVIALIDDERRERAREAAIRAREEEEVIAQQRARMEEHRERDEQARREIEEREKAERAAVEQVERDDTNVGNDDSSSNNNSSNGQRTDPPLSIPKAPSFNSMASTPERNGLCVVCQDEEANIAVVDCGYVSCSGAG